MIPRLGDGICIDYYFFLFYCFVYKLIPRLGDGNQEQCKIFKLNLAV